jgi:fermentation-respiration switch protein FrsA (DUF1100 family)
MAQTPTASNRAAPQKVTFPSGDGYVVAHLYLPENHDPSRRYPAVAIGGSLTSVKEQMGANYAGELARRGVMALVVDYRNYGESSGVKRQFEDQQSKSQDLSAALRYLKTRSDVARTGLLGICTSGGTVLYAAANDPNVGAVATVAGMFGSPDLMLKMFGPDGVNQRRAAAREARKHYDETGVIDTVAAYDPNDPTAVSTSPSEYYMDRTRGGGVRGWRNEFAVMAWEPWLNFDPLSQAPRVSAPTLIVHSERAAFPDQARRVHDLLAGPKEIHWAEGVHFDFYDQPSTVRETAERLATHFRTHLS